MMRCSVIALSLFALTGFAPPARLRAPGRAPLSISLSPSTVAGGNPVTGTILISSPAGSSGLTVTLTAPPGITIDAGANAVSGGPQGSTRIGIPAGATSATFRVLSTPVASVQQVLISGVSGNDNATVTLTINPASVRSVAVSPSTVTGGGTATLTISLDGPLAGGLVVSLSAQAALLSVGSILAASIPATVQPPAGQTSITQAVTTVPVANAQSVTISAVVSQSTVREAVPRGSPSAVLTIAPPVLAAVQLSPTSVTGGTAVVGTVVLTGPAPAQGLGVLLSSSDTAAAVPQSVVVSGTLDRASFTVSTRPVALAHGATINAVLTQTVLLPLQNTLPTTGVLTINPPKVSALSISPSSVFGGASAAATVTLDGPAPTLGFVVRPSSSNTLSAAVPSSVTIPGGSRAANIPITTKLSATPGVTATIAAGGQSLTSSVTDGTTNTVVVSELGTTAGSPSATLTISSQVLASFTAPDSARGSSGFSIVLAPATGVTTPVTVTLATNHPELLGLPATVQLSPNLLAKTLVTTKAVTTRITGVTITASAGSSAIVRSMVLTP